jgi:hypothetical protein
MFTLALALTYIRVRARYLLWEKTEGRDGSFVPLSPVPSPSPSPSYTSSESDTSDEGDATPEAFSSLPTSAYVTKLTFADRKTLCAGKYGAPSDDALWRWCVRLARHLLSVLPLFCLL